MTMQTKAVSETNTILTWLIAFEDFNAKIYWYLIVLFSR
jgi:hypothetical protein